MASLRKENDRGRVGWRLQFRQIGKRRSLWLGPMSKRSADTVARHVEELARADQAGVAASADSTAWAKSLDGRMRTTLVKWGLAEAQRKRNGDLDVRLLKTFCDSFIEDQTDLKPGTIDNFGHARRLLVEYFGQDKPLAAIAPGDTARWKRWLLARPVKVDADGKTIKTMASSTVSKHLKRAKTMFTAAVADRIIPESPFDSVKADGEVNRDRDYIVSPEETTAALAACPDAAWRAIFGLARFGGLRACEILVMTWDDVLWDVNRLRINSPKTGLRFAPIFPELLPILRESFEVAPDRAVKVTEPRRYNYVSGEGGTNLGTLFKGILERGGVQPWAKPMQNLRVTRRNELEAIRPNHVVNAWLGHSKATADKHYLMVTEDQWDLAIGQPTSATLMDGVRTAMDQNDTAESGGGVTGGVITADPCQSGAQGSTKKPLKTVSFQGSRCVVSERQATLLGDQELEEIQQIVASTLQRWSAGGQQESTEILARKIVANIFLPKESCCPTETTGVTQT